MAAFHSADWKSNSRFRYKRSSLLLLKLLSCRNQQFDSHTSPSRKPAVRRLSFSLCLLALPHRILCPLLCPSCYVTNSWSCRNPVCWRWFSLREAFIVSLWSHALLGCRAALLLCAVSEGMWAWHRARQCNLTVSCHVTLLGARRGFKDSGWWPTCRNRIIEIRRTQLYWNVLYLLYNFIQATCFDLLKRGHHHAIEVFTKSHKVYAYLLGCRSVSFAFKHTQRWNVWN
jgi:hypothetical protein